MRLPVAGLMLMGIAVITIGGVLMFCQQAQEAHFQELLLSKFGHDYHWRSVGGTYTGLGALVVGALMMVLAALSPR